MEEEKETEIESFQINKKKYSLIKTVRKSKNSSGGIYWCSQNF